MTQIAAGSGSASVPRRARGSISRLPSGSLRVRVYAGADPATGRPAYLSETVGPGPTARAQAEQVCRRLLGRVQRRRCLRTNATVNELLDRHLAMLYCGEHTRESYEYLATKHIRPVLGGLRLVAVTAERLDGLYAQLLRCREQCPPRAEAAAHVCRPLHPGTVRKIHYLLQGRFAGRCAGGGSTTAPPGR